MYTNKYPCARTRTRKITRAKSVVSAVINEICLSSSVAHARTCTYTQTHTHTHTNHMRTRADKTGPKTLAPGWNQQVYIQAHGDMNTHTHARTRSIATLPFSILMFYVFFSIF